MDIKLQYAVDQTFDEWLAHARPWALRRALEELVGKPLFASRHWRVADRLQYLRERGET